MCNVFDVIEIHFYFYQIMTPDSERRNSTAMYNPMKLSELEE